MVQLSAVVPLIWAILIVVPRRITVLIFNAIFRNPSDKSQGMQKPSVIQTTLSRCLHISPTSTKLNLQSEFVVRTIRAVINQPQQPTISGYQAINTHDRPTRGPTWACRVVTLPTEDERDACQALLNIVENLGRKEQSYPPSIPEEVYGEWVGYRKGVDSRATEPDLSEAEKFQLLMHDISSEFTILYLHGGSLFHGSPTNNRPAASKLAKYTCGRCFSVGYRLAPKFPFPAALLDTLYAYLSLLYPPEGSLHTSVSASSLVVAGDSAGGNLCLALVQLILQFQRQSPDFRIRFHGRSVQVPLPAGIATISAYADLTHALPSWIDNAKYDYLPPENPLLSPDFPSCKLWPVEPPRASVYCNDDDICHPLISRTIADSWRGAPPMWFGYGEEMLAHEGKVIAQRAADQGSTVVWQQYKAMPHIFPTLPVLN